MSTVYQLHFSAPLAPGRDSERNYTGFAEDLALHNNEHACQRQLEMPLLADVCAVIPDSEGEVLQ